MYLAAYHFTGDPAALLAAHDRFLAADARESVDLHVCVAEDGGILVLDACPSRAAFEGFGDSQEFRSALSAAGLPQPRVEGLGEVHCVHPTSTVVAS